MNETLILKLIGRENDFFFKDLIFYKKELEKIILSSTFLVIGGAGSIGQTVVKEIFRRNPKKLHVVDINENNMVELIRDIRSSLGYIKGDFRAYTLDISSLEYDAFIQSDGNYDYVLNFSALKHVRSEKDPFTLMRMIDVNILNTEKTLIQSITNNTRKYFCVSTDKATNPVNMMGASKRIMEMFLMRRSFDIEISTSRFANVAFSDGSLLHGFTKRIEKSQPIVSPKDIRRYFITPKESAELCLMSCIFGENRDIFFPKFSKDIHLMSFSEIAINYLSYIGYEPYLCSSEEEARDLIKSLPGKGKWPCLFINSDTTGEKYFEEFFTSDESLDMDRFDNIGIIKSEAKFNNECLDQLIQFVENSKSLKVWTKDQIVEAFFKLIPDFDHKETGKYLDEKM